MYYSADQPPPTISYQSPQLPSYEPLVRQQKRRLYIFVVGAALIIFGGGAWWYGKIQAVLSPPGASQAQTSPTPTITQEPRVAGVSFGDLLKKQRSYVGWMAGVADGDIVLMNPSSGEINTLTDVESQWFGPASALVWSPDRSKLAYLALPHEEAAGFSTNPKSQAQKMGLDAVPTPQTFPFGKVVILDIHTKQLIQTGMEVRNTPKSIIWLDDNQVAAITTGLTLFNLSEGQTTAVAGAGVTDSNEQLQSPLAWDKNSESIFFTKVKKEGNQGARVIVQVSLKNNSAIELATVNAGKYEEVSISRGVDMALDAEAERLAFITKQGLAYLSLADGGVHALPPQDDWLWLKDSIISDVEWLSPSKVAFVSMANDGTKVWTVWDIPESKMLTFGRGSDAGSWDKASGRLALAESSSGKVNILTPNWQEPLKSGLESLDLPWQTVAW